MQKNEMDLFLFPVTLPGGNMMLKTTPSHRKNQVSKA